MTARGFTLVEVLVALAILSLAASIAVESLSLGSRVWRTEIAATARGDELSRARALLTRLLTEAYPQDPQAPPSLRQAAVDSDGHSLELSASPPGYAQSGGLARWWVYRERSDTPSDLRAVWSLDSTRPSSSDSRSEVLIKRVSGWRLAFLTRGLPGQSAWVDRWSLGQGLPQLVRVEVSFPAGDPRSWVPLIVQPKLDAPAECEFDLVSRRCRGAP